MNVKHIAILLAHALVGWMLCAAIIGVGFQLWSMETTLIVHALGVPVVFLLVSGSYFRWFAYTTPFQTALVFVTSAILLDFFVVALVIQKSFDMFTSPIGTWIPFALIFLTTYMVGKYTERRSQQTAPA